MLRTAIQDLCPILPHFTVAVADMHGDRRNSTARIFFPKLETAAASISEGDHLVWDRTGFHDGCPGVEFGEEHGGSIILNVGSGVYSFLLNLSGEAYNEETKRIIYTG